MFKFGKRIVSCLMGLALVACMPLVACSSGSQLASSSSSSSSVVAQEVTVTLVVDASAGDGEHMDRTVTVSEGSTVLDALRAAPVDVEVEDSSYGPFVVSINGLSNGDKGSQSGWTYTVNDEYPTEGADAVEISNGDTVTWTYVV